MTENIDEPKVSVGILTDRKISFDLYGDFRLRGMEKRFSGRFRIELSESKISLFQDANFITSQKEFIFDPYDFGTDSFLIHDVVIGKEFHWQKKLNQRFRGRLKFIIEDSSVTAVNILNVEEYLSSVISSEMSSNSSLELLKAHAIISRSWLLAQLDKKKSGTEDIKNEFSTDTEIIRWYDRGSHKNYDLCADDHCQRYQGVLRVTNDNALQAVELTRGLVLMHDNKICDARYSKCCGGITENFENVWQPLRVPYLTSVFDYKFEPDGYILDLTKENYLQRWIKSNPHAYCNTSNKSILNQVLVDFDRDTNDFFRWKVEYTQNELAEIIKYKSGIDFGNIISLYAEERGVSGRIVKLKITGSKKEMVIGKELEIRRTLSSSHLYSSAFYVTTENTEHGVPGKFIFHGAGWGHGVGLCQIGAAVMGELGHRFDEILLHYFTGSKIHKIYE